MAIIEQTSPQKKSVLTSSRLERTAWIVIVALLGIGAYLLLFGLNMRRGLNHDEHQFVAGAALLAREALLPYVDFPFFHVPLQSLVNALLFQFSDRLLLATRLVSVACAWLSLGLVFFAAFRRKRAAQLRTRLAFGTLAAVWLLSLPLFIYTSGRAWNHDLPLLLTLIAFFVHSDALIERRAPGWLGASGLLMGLATAARLSFGFAALAFLLAIWLYPAYRGQGRGKASAAFLLGFLIGALPALVLLALDPQAFFFGNVTYVRLNTQYYRMLTEPPLGMTLAGKLRALGELLLRQPASLLALVALIAALWPLRRTMLQRSSGALATKDRSLFRLLFALLLAGFLLIGALVPTPSQPQYFYPLFPFVVLAAIYALAAWPPAWSPWADGLLAAVVLASVLLAAPSYLPGLQIVARPDAWYPNKVASRGALLAGLIGRGRVLTLAPIHPLEGGADIYPEFATGAFAWRVAPLASPEERQRFGLVGPDDLDAFLAEQPPRGLLTGLDNDDTAAEAPLVAYAEEHRFLPLTLPDEGVLWLSPLAVWNDAVQLGAHTLQGEPAAPGATLFPTFYLQSLAPIERDLNLLVRLVDGEGKEWARSDGWPWGSPTSTWRVGDVWPDGRQLVLPPQIPNGVYRVDLSFYDPETLDEFGAPAAAGFVVVDDAPRPCEGEAVGTLAGRFRLLDLDVPTAPLQPGGRLPLTLVWCAAEPSSLDYTVFVHLIGPDGQVAAQYDQAPVDGLYPTSAWQPNVSFEDPVTIPLPETLLPGDYHLLVGMYDPATMGRLPVDQAGQPPGDAIYGAALSTE